MRKLGKHRTGSSLPLYQQAGGRRYGCVAAKWSSESVAYMRSANHIAGE